MKLIKRVNKYIFVISFILSILFTFYSFSLPDESNVNALIKDNKPIIEPLNKEPYFTKFEDIDYEITPLYSYEAYGVIVEHYDSDNWLDVTHRGDPAQTKDICIVWGENIKSNIYRQIKYSHGEFTCYAETKSREVWDQFNMNELTNNHLIPTNDELAKKMKRTRIGDQIYIRGELVNYKTFDENGNLVSFRKTSNTMEDRDCEVVLVHEYEVIRSRHPLIKNASEYSYSSLGLSTVVGIILFIFF